VIHTDVTELTETTSVTFLGMSITCCRCHNHPLEKWTQDQYWSLANLFSRVGLKNGDKAGETLVQSKPGGDVLHLRKASPCRRRRWTASRWRWTASRIAGSISPTG